MDYYKIPLGWTMIFIFVGLCIVQFILLIMMAIEKKTNYVDMAYNQIKYIMSKKDNNNPKLRNLKLISKNIFFIQVIIVIIAIVSAIIFS